jgi:hypothetical protein
MDRRVSDELRARQQGGSRPPPPVPPSYGDPGAMSASWMDGVGASQYYGAAAGRPGTAQPPPYSRPYGQQPYGDPTMAASMYRQHPAQAYGYVPPASGGVADRYGYAPPHHHDMYVRHHYPPPHGLPSSTSKSSPPNPAVAVLTDASVTQSSAKTPSNFSPGSKIEGNTPNSKGEDDQKPPSTPPSFAGSTESPKSSSKKASAAKSKKKTTAHEVTELEDLHIDKWYSGSIPLGLEDDKYWLSELQVYLRANFAEAFGATEEDIAAPMHGRNKPIALGQVGIRCIWCKRKCQCVFALMTD